MNDNRSACDTVNGSTLAEGKFDKTVWRRAIRDDKRLSLGVKYVLQGIAWDFVKHGGNGILRTTQAHIAKAELVSDKQVRNAFAEARKYGYFELVDRRKAGPGRHVADTYRLVIPSELPEQFAGSSTGTDRQNYRNDSPELPEQLTGNYRNRLSVTDFENGLTTSDDDVEIDSPMGSKYLGSNMGRESGTDAPPPSLHSTTGEPTTPRATGARLVRAKVTGDPSARNPTVVRSDSSTTGLPASHHANGARLTPYGEPRNHDDGEHPWEWEEFIPRSDHPDVPVQRPSRFCDRHPTGTSEPCGGCKDRKQLLSDWVAVHNDWMEHNGAEKAYIRECKFCFKSHGLFTDDDGLWWCGHPTELPPEGHGWNFDPSLRWP